MGGSSYCRKEFLELPGRSHSVLGVSNRLIHISDRPRTPTAFVMLGSVEFSPRCTQMFKRTSHTGLVGPHRSDA